MTIDLAQQVNVKLVGLFAGWFVGWLVRLLVGLMFALTNQPTSRS
jgi:hypothetical protein